MRRIHTRLWAVIASLCITSSFASAQVEDILRGRSASENIVFGRLVKVSENRLNLSIGEGETARVLNLVPETVVEIDGQPIRLGDLPPDARLRVLLDAERPDTARRILVLQEAQPVTPAPMVNPPVIVTPSPAPVTIPPTTGTSGDAPRAAVDIDPIPPVLIGGVFQTAPAGVLVRTLETDHAAARAGLQVGDAIKTVGGQNVATVDGFFRVLHKYPASAKVPVIAIRDNKEVALEMQLPSTHRPYLVDNTSGSLGAPNPRPVDVITTGQLGWTLSLQAGRIRIVAIDPDSPAALSGFQVGDEIVSVQQERVATPEAVLAIIQDHGDATSVPVTIRRGPELLTRGLALPRANTVAANRFPQDSNAGNEIPPSPNAAGGDTRLDQILRQQADQKQLILDLQTEIRLLREELAALRAPARSNP